MTMLTEKQTFLYKHFHLKLGHPSFYNTTLTTRHTPWSSVHSPLLNPSCPYQPWAPSLTPGSPVCLVLYLSRNHTASIRLEKVPEIIEPKLVLPGWAQAGGVPAAILWHSAPWQRRRAPWRLEKSRAWSDESLRVEERGREFRESVLAEQRVDTHSYFAWESLLFCRSLPRCVHWYRVGGSKRAFPRSTLHRCCMFSLLPKCVLYSWIFPNPPLASGLWPQTKENSVMNVVNLKPIIVSKVNNGKTDYQQITLLRTQFWRDPVFPLTKQCHRNWPDVCLLNLPIYYHAFPIA